MEQPNMGNGKPPVREGFVAAEQPAAAEQQPAIDGQVAPQGPPMEPPETWPKKVRLLYKPIRNNAGVSVQEVSFREPTAGDINRYGCPVRINPDNEIIIDERKMMVMMSALSGILQPFIEQMDPRDWQSCAYRLRGFFLPETGGWI